MKNILIFKTAIVVLGLLFANFGYSQQIKGNYAIQNVETELLLRPKNASKQNEAPIVLYSPVNWKCLTWNFKHVEGNTYQLENLFSSKTFHPENNNAEAMVALKQTPLQEENSFQQWEFIPTGNDAYRIRLKNTELYLTPADNSGNTNTEVNLQKKLEGNLQLWTIYEQHPTM
ncbi:MAG: RICIN domain-containing protein [Marinilabilia sp.]